MIPRPPSAPVRRRLVLVALAATAARALLQAEPAPHRLDPYITTATRTPSAPRTLGSAVESLAAEELSRRHVTSVSAALGTAAGAPAFASGGPGSATSLFLRGANSNQTLFLVDGIRLNDSNTDYQTFLGGASLGAYDRIEIARGPQSTLYGAEAIGGVVSVGATRGVGAPGSRVLAEGGSFGTIVAGAATRGSRGSDAWNASIRAAHTDNDRPHNGFDSANAVVRLDRQVSETLGLGGTVRWYHGELGSPGDRFTNDPNNSESEDNLLATAFVDAKLGTAWTARATLGAQSRRYVAESPAPNPPWEFNVGTVVVENRRGVLDAQTTFAGIERHRVTAGTTIERLHTRNTGFGAIDETQDLLAVFAQDEFSASDTLYLTGGLRIDDFDTFGHATTGRATLAWLPVPETLKVRASYGTGFRSPSFLDLYGRDAYYVGNPDLRPEHQRGVDAGFDWYLPSQRGTISATWFRSEFRDLIDYNFGVFPATVVNVGRARTQGLELTAKTVLPAAVALTVSYTYLDARALQDAGDTRLLRRPRHSVHADAHREIAGRLVLGGSVRIASGRRDVDAQTYATIDAEDFTVATIYATWQATPRLALKARFENVLDEQYEEVNGYPARGLGAFAGVEWEF